MNLCEVDLFEPLCDLDLEQLVVYPTLEPGPHLLRLVDVVENSAKKRMYMDSK